MSDAIPLPRMEQSQSEKALGDALIRAVSTLQNYGQHHAWCHRTFDPHTCDCGYEKVLNELDAIAFGEGVVRELLAATQEPWDALRRAAERLVEVRHGGECGIAKDDLDALSAALRGLGGE